MQDCEQKGCCGEPEGGLSRSTGSDVLDLKVGFGISDEQNRQGIRSSARDIGGGRRNGTLAGMALCVVEWTRVEAMVEHDKYQKFEDTVRAVSGRRADVWPG